MLRVYGPILAFVGAFASGCGPDNSQPQNQQQIEQQNQESEAPVDNSNPSENVPEGPQIESFAIRLVIDCKDTLGRNEFTSETLPRFANSIELTELNNRTLTLWTDYHTPLDITKAGDGEYLIGLTYEPANTSDFIGRAVADLSDVQGLRIHLASDFKALGLQLGPRGIANLIVTVNQRNVINVDLGSRPEAKDMTTTIDVSEPFRAIQSSFEAVRPN